MFDNVVSVMCIVLIFGSAALLWYHRIPIDTMVEARPRPLKRLQIVSLTGMCGGACLSLLRLIPSDAVTVLTVPFLVSLCANTIHAVVSKARRPPVTPS